MTPEARPARSLRTRLVTALSLLMLLVALLAAVGGTLRAQQEAAESQDELLSQIARLVDRSGALEAAGAASPSDPSGIAVEDITVDDGHDLPSDLPDGLSSVTVAGVPQRVMVRELPDGRRIAVAQPESVRGDAVRETVLSTLLPLALALPLLVLGGALVVGWALRPLEALRQELASRAGDEFAPLPRDAVPAELGGLLDAVDTHHERAAVVVEGQRRFAAEAAHELRTPIAAVSFQAEHLLATSDPQLREQRGRALEEGIARLRSLAEQLLVLGDEAPPHDRPAPLGEAVRSLAGEMLSVPEAVAADVRFELGEAESAEVPSAATSTALRNLLGNALRFAADVGPIEVRARLHRDGVVLEVLDRGPGIRDPERALTPFHREASQEIPGHGLGLAITARALEQCGGRLMLEPRPGGGTTARAVLPLIASAPGNS